MHDSLIFDGIYQSHGSYGGIVIFDCETCFSHRALLLLIFFMMLKIHGRKGWQKSLKKHIQVQFGPMVFNKCNNPITSGSPQVSPEVTSLKLQTAPELENFGETHLQWRTNATKSVGFSRGFFFWGGALDLDFCKKQDVQWMSLFGILTSPAGG